MKNGISFFPWQLKSANWLYIRLVTTLLVAVGVPMAACSQPSGNNSKDEKKMADQKKQIVYFDVALFSYLERPIFDVFLNGKDIGLAAGQPHRGEANGLMTGVKVTPGEQTVTWRDAGTGKNFKATNIPALKSLDPQLQYLGVHIYPDNSVEIIPERYWPEKTAKGEAINRAWELKHGK